MTEHRHQSSSVVRHLRDAARQEVATSAAESEKSEPPKFDHDHDRTPRTHETKTAEDFDSDNGVAQYPGPQIPHIGNGPGGIR